MKCVPDWLWKDELYVIIDIDGGVGRVVNKPQDRLLGDYWQPLHHFWDWDDPEDEWWTEWGEWLPEQ